MSDMTCKIKNRTNEEMAARREYGIPARKGHKCFNLFSGMEEINTESSDFCNFISHPVSSQRAMFIKHIKNGSDKKYVEFLQDYFYRKYKGYATPYMELPLDNPIRLGLYNQVALDSGHPEYMIDEHGDVLKMKNQRKSVAAGGKKRKDVVIIDKVRYPGVYANSQAAEASETANDKKPKVKASKVGATKGQQHMAQNAVKFDPAKLGGKSSGDRKDDPERKDDYTNHNSQLLKQYPELECFIDICGNDKVVKFDNFHGLVLATVYHKNVPEAVDTAAQWVIDPGKIRPGFSVLTENPTFLETGYRNPLNTVGIGFNELYIKSWLFGMPTEADMADAYNKSSVNNLFYRYIAYNAFENNEIALASANVYWFVDRLAKMNLNVRFKVVNKRSADDFDLQITDNVGLGFFAKDNEKFKGLVVNIKKLNGYIYTTASGKHANEFADIVNSLGMMVSVQPAQEEPKAKPEKKEGKAKKNKTVELPNGR